MKIPEHIAIILDGNGRWAKKRGMPRTYGHTAGAKNVEKICEVAGELGIRYLTVYAFSTENWSRPEDEVGEIMKLLGAYIKKCKKLAKKNDMRVRVIGDITKLSEELQKQIIDLEEYTSSFDRFHFQIALNYGSRDEILRGMKKMVQDMTIGQYYNANSLIHRLDPRVKITFTFIYVISLFFPRNIPAYVFAFVVLAAYIRISRVPLRFIVKGLKSLIMILLFTVILQLFTSGEKRG